MSELRECERCGRIDLDVRMSLVNRWREERQLGRQIPTGPEYAHGYRCADKDACLARVKVTHETR